MSVPALCHAVMVESRSFLNNQKFSLLAKMGSIIIQDGTNKKSSNDAPWEKAKPNNFVGQFLHASKKP